jgi:hypothetical protein
MKNLQSFEQFLGESSVNEANISFYRNVVQQAIKDALGHDVKQSDVKVGAKKQSGGYDLITLNGKLLCSSSQHDEMLRSATNAIKEDPAKYGLKESSVNEAEKMTFDEVADEYKDNPYGIGASRIAIVGDEPHHAPGHRIMVFNCESDAQRSKVMQKLKDMGFPAKKMTKTMQDKGYMYRYQVNLFEGAVAESETSLMEAEKWSTKNLDSRTFYNFWASVDQVASDVSDYMDNANSGNTDKALMYLKSAYNELNSLLQRKDLEKQLKGMEAELKEKGIK